MHGALVGKLLGYAKYKKDNKGIHKSQNRHLGINFYKSFLVIKA